MAVIGSMIVNLEARTAAFDVGMQKARRSVETFSAAQPPAISALNSFAKALAAVGAAAAIKSAISGAVNYGSELSDLSTRLGASTESLARLRHAAELNGSSTEAMDTGLGKLALTLGQVQGGSDEAIKKFEALGLNAQQLAASGPAEAFKQIVGGLERITDPSARAAAAFQIFGKQGKDLIGVLAAGTKGLDEAAASSDALGASIGQNTADRFERLGDMMTEIKTGVKGVTIELTAQLLPVLEKAGQGLVNFLKAVNQDLLPTMKPAFEFISSIASGIVEVFHVAQIAILDFALAATKAYREVKDFFGMDTSGPQALIDSLQANRNAIGAIGPGEVPGLSPVENRNPADSLQNAAEKLDDAASETKAAATKRVEMPGLAPALLKGTAAALSYQNKQNLPRFSKLEQAAERTAKAVEQDVEVSRDVAAAVREIQMPIVVEFA
jgi:hypothetical protein